MEPTAKGGKVAHIFSAHVFQCALYYKTLNMRLLALGTGEEWGMEHRGGESEIDLSETVAMLAHLCVCLLVRSSDGSTSLLAVSDCVD